MGLHLPKFLNIPDKLHKIISGLNIFRYFLIEGGRGSAKSQTIARLILFIGGMRKVRVVCGREIQVSIEESVYALFCDLIEEFHLDYYVGKKLLRHRVTGTTIRFRGFREHGAINIKGLEGVDILYVDEAQALTHQTLKILMPTIRKNKAKVFFVMNRHIAEDPAYIRTVGRKDCLHIHIDFHENPHCTDALKTEAKECFDKNREEYDHIWLGEPMRQASKAAFRGVEGIVDLDLPVEIRSQTGFTYVLGVDLAKSIDHTTMSVLCVELKEQHYYERMENENKASWYYQKEKIKAISKLYNDAVVVPDSTGLGDPITEDLQRAGVNVFVDTANQDNPKEVAGVKFTQRSKKNLIEKLKISIELQCFRIPYIKQQITQLKQYEAVKMASGQIRYGAPAGKDENGDDVYHDDDVMSLALALWGSRDMIYNPSYKAPQDVTNTDRFWTDVKKQLSRKESENNSLQDNDESGIINLSDGIEIKEELL